MLGHGVIVARWCARAGLGPPQEVALTAMLVVQCLVLFFLAPFAALGYAVPRVLGEASTLMFGLLVVAVSRGRLATVVVTTALGVSLIGLLLEGWAPSPVTGTLMHVSAS